MICLSSLKLIFIFLFHFVSGQRQYFYCPFDCQGRTASKCSIEYISSEEKIRNNDTTLQSAPAPTQCSIEVSKIQQNSKFHPLAFARTNFSFPKMEGDIKLDKFILLIFVGIEPQRYEVRLKKDKEFRHNEMHVTVDLCNVEISGNKAYDIDVVTSPYNGESSEICSDAMKTGECCEPPLKNTYQCSSKDCKDDVFTTQFHPFTPKSDKPETRRVKSSFENKTKIMFAAGIGVFLLAIALGATAHYRKSKTPSSKKLVVLVSSGDQEGQYADMANEIASEMKENGGFEDVYFSGWQTQTNDNSVVQLRGAIENCSVALLLSSPCGKRSYEEFLGRKELSTWKDAFVFGSYALYHQSYFSFQQQTKIYVAYISEDEAEIHSHVHEDFSSAKKRFYNLSKPSDVSDLYLDMRECNRMLS